MGKNKFMRDLSHLISELCSEKEVLSYLQEVEDNFNLEWLVSKSGHKLQLLWERRDALSTNELFAIGKSISVLKIKHKVWLKKCISDIKKQPKGAHGYITEMLAASSITSENALTIPAPSNKPGYDVSIETKGKNVKRILISVKNHDITKHYFEFNKRSQSLRDKFVSVVKALGISARLAITTFKPMTLEIYTECFLMLHFWVKGTGIYRSRDGLVLMNVSALDDYDGWSVISGSDLCMVLSPFHRNEHAGFKKKLEEASVNMNKHLPKDDNTVRMLYMRIHHSANAKALIEIANRMIVVDENCGFDQVLLFQPSVARTHDGASAIHTCFQYSDIKQATPQRNFFGVFKCVGRINFDLPIGTISPSPSRLLLMDGGAQVSNIHDHYMYQRGDVFVRAKEQDGGSYFGAPSSPASGIHVIPVFELNGNSMLLQAIKPQHEELLLI
ncbi:hypothetical protein [Pantoea ananatis]|uniref:hypothetical protein n=1 Tax=Pantoea ananas TaxID=553 RepID=UPI001B30F928|nr:hypothetical protein [Pantoea ananatis]